MFLEIQWHRSQLPQQDPLVCLEALPAALWNRRVLEESSLLGNEGDYALIKDFNLPQGDRIQLKGIAQDYRLGTSSVAMRPTIFWQKGQLTPELIAIVQGDALTNLNDGFDFV